MSMTLSTIHSKTPVNIFSPKITPRIHSSNNSVSFISSPSSSSSTAHPNPLNRFQGCSGFYGPFKKYCDGFAVKSRGFTVKAQNERASSDNAEKDEMDYRGLSTMPERFRHLAKEAPDKPLWWPWLTVLAFMLYAWRAVLLELFNWKMSVGPISRFLKHMSKFVLAPIFPFIGDPLISSIRGVETTLYAIRAFYSSILAYAPIPELTLIIMLTSAVLAIAEATVPDSVSSQPYILTVAGVIGFAAVRNYISERLFWTLLVGLFGFARLVKRRDYVSSALPAAAVLAAVGEPWVRLIAMGSYLGLAIFYHSNKSVDLKEDENAGAIKRVPAPLVCAALVIGVRVVAKWAGYRHLTWMIV